MNADLNGTTCVSVELRGRRATIADVRQALDTLVADDIPETFEVSIRQYEDREHAPDKAREDRKVEYVFSIEAERASRLPERGAAR